jgi:hypothetical protein
VLTTGERSSRWWRSIPGPSRHGRSPLAHDKRARGEVAEALVPARSQDRDHADDVERGQEVDDAHKIYWNKFATMLKAVAVVIVPVQVLNVLITCRFPTGSAS